MIVIENLALITSQQAINFSNKLAGSYNFHFQFFPQDKIKINFSSFNLTEDFYSK